MNTYVYKCFHKFATETSVFSLRYCLVYNTEYHPSSLTKIDSQQLFLLPSRQYNKMYVLKKLRKKNLQGTNSFTTTFKETAAIATLQN